MVLPPINMVLKNIIYIIGLIGINFYTIFYALYTLLGLTATLPCPQVLVQRLENWIFYSHKPTENETWDIIKQLRHKYPRASVNNVILIVAFLDHTHTMQYAEVNELTPREINHGQLYWYDGNSLEAADSH